jgi:dienelactone hydrolase
MEERNYLSSMKSGANTGSFQSDKKKVKISADGVNLEGELVIPISAEALVIFAHGSGSSRFSPRNNFVAQQLQRNRIATFLVDLLSEKEDDIFAMRFNIELLTDRLVTITERLLENSEVEGLPIGLFGASTGAACALRTAAQLPHLISAVVSRGGRPDLSLNFLKNVNAPTLLIVGELDHEVIEYNRRAFDELTCIKQLSIIPGATHLFEEKGSLEEVATQAASWFSQYLTGERIIKRKKEANRIW